jgi:arginine decarboxylase
VTAGCAEGPTALAAFDAALLQTGAANYNLILLSSVIPPGCSIERARFVTPPDEYGHRLYVVLARHDEHEIGSEAWAGLGWTQEPASGRGLFVEAHGQSEHSVGEYIDATLTSMVATREYPYGSFEREIVGITCHGQPVCAVVLAVYRSEPWELEPER